MGIDIDKNFLENIGIGFNKMILVGL